MKQLIIIAAAAACAYGLNAGAAAEDAGKKVLEIEYPKPLFVGTPVKTKLPNLEEPRKEGAPPPVFMVPEGTKNLSYGKEVTSSDEYPIIGDLEMVTDGDMEGTDGSYVELGPGLQWVQIDLGKESTLYAIMTWHFHSQPRAYLDMVVQLANDPDFIEGVTTIYNNDHDNSAGFGVGKDKTYIETNHGRVADAKGAKARYVRLYTKGNTANEMNHYIEVSIFGKPAE